MRAARVVVVLAATLALAGGCKKSVGELKTIDVAGDAPGDPAHPASVHIGMQAGQLHLTPGGAHVVGGSARSNVSDLDPHVEIAGTKIDVTQGKGDAMASAGKYGGDLIADWRLTLGTTPVALAIETGTGAADLELGGLSLKSASVKTGTGAIAVAWNAPNPMAAESLDIESGAGSITLTDVGRMGASKIRAHSGVGSVVIVMGSKIDRDVVLDLEASAGSLTVKVPVAVTARADVKKGAGSITASGWSKDGDVYELGAPGAPPRVNITARTGAGSITLEAVP